MEESTQSSNIVNQNPKFFLDFDENNKLVLIAPSGQRISLNDDPFAAWFIRTHCKHVDASPAARTWFLTNDPTNIGDIPFLKNPLKLFQKLALKRMQMSNAANWLDMGLGKTLIFLAFCLQLISQKRIFVVLCPLSVFESWIDEVNKHIDTSANVHVVFAHGTQKKKVLSKLRALPDDNSRYFVVTTYESLSTVAEALLTLRDQVGAIYLDEAQRVKNAEAQRTKHCHKFVRDMNVPTFEASGTPSTTHVDGYFSLYELLRPGASGCGSLIAFKDKYEESKKFYVAEIPTSGEPRIQNIFAENEVGWLKRNLSPDGKTTFYDAGYSFAYTPRHDKEIRILRCYHKVIGTKNLDQLKLITDTWAYALRKEEVLDQLPPKTCVKRFVDMTEEQDKCYREMVETCRTEINGTKFSFRNQNSPHCKLHQIANGFLKKQDDTYEFFKQQPKLAEILSILEEHGQQKVVIWSPMRLQLEQLENALREEGYDGVSIHGGVPANVRVTRIARFKQDPHCDFFLSNPSVGGVGLNLQCAHLEIWATNWNRPDERNQAIDRCHRQGQSNAVTIIDVITRDTLELKILTSLEAQIDLEDSLLSVADLTGGRHV